MLKKLLAIMLVLSLALSMGLGIRISDFSSITAHAEVIDIPDAALKRELNKKLGVANPKADITREQLESITNFLLFFESDVASLEGIQYCKNLTSLKVYDAQMTKIPSFKNLKKLEYLTLCRCEKLTDISGLAKIEDKTVLKTLNFEGTIHLKDLTPLTGFTAVEEIDLEKVKPNKEDPDKYYFTPLASMTGLKEIEFAFCDLGNGEDGLGYQSKLKTLFTALTKLEQVGLGYNELTSVACLVPRRKTLKKLSIYGNAEVTDKQLDNIKKFTKLTAFMYGGTGLCNFSFLSVMPNMTDDTWRWAEDEVSIYKYIKLDVDMDAAKIQYKLENPVVDDKGNAVAPKKGTNYKYNATTNMITIKPADDNERFHFVDDPIEISFSVKFSNGETKKHIVRLRCYLNNPSFAVSMDLNGGTGSTISKYSSWNAVKLSNPSKKGYTFTGWTGSNGTTPERGYTIPMYTKGDLNFKANYELRRYNLTYELNGGKVSTANPKTYTVETPTFTLNNPTKKGYKFTGWSGTGISIQDTAVTVAKGSTGERSYEANYSMEKYTIAYNLNGGNVTGNPTTYNVETDSFTLKNPTRKGYTFNGWKTSEDGTPIKTMTIAKGTTGHLNFMADFRRVDYNIAYTLNGGSVTGNPTTYHIETPTFTLNNPTKKGYTFNGWKEGATATPVKTVSIAKGSTGNRSYTADFTRDEYSITYDLAGGSVVGNPASYNVETETFTLKNPAKKGYTFVGWKESANATPVSVVTINKGSAGKKNYIAVFTKDSYRITYGLDGAKITNPTSFAVDTPTFTLKNPAKRGYTFFGWTGSNGTTAEKTITIESGSVGNRSYKANFTKTAYTITYNYNGANAEKNPTKFYFDSKSFTLKNPTLKGYIFKGWTGSCGSIPQMEVKVDTSDLSNKTYTAVWEPMLNKLPYLKTTKIITKGSKFKLGVYGVKKNCKVVWNNSNPKVVEIKKNTLIAKKNGNSTIGYRLYDQYGQMIYGFKLKVMVITSNAQTLNTSKKIKTKHPVFVFDKTLLVGKKFKLGFNNLEKGCKLTYKSSDKKILTVTKRGVVRAKKKGFAYVTIKLVQHGNSYEYRVHFKAE